MTALSIRIFSAGSWGELGNQLAARALSANLSRISSHCVTCGPIEDIAPIFATIGNRIRTLSLAATDAADRARRYRALMDELARDLFVEGFEERDEGSGLTTTINAVAAEIRASGAQVVIGTKGAIARILTAAVRRLDRPVGVINHITNHGLLALDIHAAKLADAHTVQLEEARTIVAARCGVESERIFVLGAFTAAEDLSAALSDKVAAPLPRPRSDLSTRIVILSNRGGPPYLELAHLLAASAHAAEMDVLFIDTASDSAVQSFNEIAAAAGLGWRGYGRIPQSTYLAELAALRTAARPLLVCKPGPNTVMEALRIGVPCLLLESGLPMEEWVGDFVRGRGIGFVARDPRELATEIGRIAAGTGNGDWRRRIACLRDELFRPDVTRAGLDRALAKAWQLAQNRKPASVRI